MQIISEQYILQHRSGLQGMYNAVLDFFPKHYANLREITTGAGQGYVFIPLCVSEEMFSCCWSVSLLFIRLLKSCG